MKDEFPDYFSDRLGIWAVWEYKSRDEKGIEMLCCTDTVVFSQSVYHKSISWLLMACGEAPLGAAQSLDWCRRTLG